MCAEVQVNLAYRWFCKLGTLEAVISGTSTFNLAKASTAFLSLSVILMCAGFHLDLRRAHTVRRITTIVMCAGNESTNLKIYTPTLSDDCDVRFGPIRSGRVGHAGAISTFSISVGSSSLVRELFTRFDTGHFCNKSFGAGFKSSMPAVHFRDKVVGLANNHGAGFERRRSVKYQGCFPPGVGLPVSGFFRPDAGLARRKGLRVVDEWYRRSRWRDYGTLPTVKPLWLKEPSELVLSTVGLFNLFVVMLPALTVEGSLFEIAGSF